MDLRPRSSLRHHYGEGRIDEEDRSLYLLHHFAGRPNHFLPLVENALQADRQGILEAERINDGKAEPSAPIEAKLSPPAASRQREPQAVRHGSRASGIWNRHGSRQ